MKKIILILVLILPILKSYGQDSATISFEIRKSTEQVFQGEPFHIMLIIHDPNLKNILDINDKISIDTSAFPLYHSNSFIYESFIKFDNIGENQIGPLQINYQNINLTSNVLYVNVLSRVKGNFVFFNLLGDKKKGSTATLEVESDGIDIFSLQLNESEFFKITSKNTSSSTSTVNGKTKQKKTLQFEIIFTKSGDLLFSDKSFENFPEDLTIEPLTIEIE